MSTRKKKPQLTEEMKSYELHFFAENGEPHITYQLRLRMDEFYYCVSSSTRCKIPECKHLLAFHDDDNICLIPDCPCGREVPRENQNMIAHTFGVIGSWAKGGAGGPAHTGPGKQEGTK
jgi:hypothetical protein